MNKTALFTPLLKKKSLDRNELKNDHPISGLPFLSKLIEHTVNVQIQGHLTLNNLQNTYQSAYKVGHSTETALLSIKNEIKLTLAKGNPTALVMLDLSTAFDTIDHTTLVDCLSKWFGFSGSILCTVFAELQDYLYDIQNWMGSSISD
jgi:hypothetical protein